MTHQKKAKHWFGGLPDWAQAPIGWVLVALAIAIIVLMSIGLQPKAIPTTNYIADWDGKSQVVVSYDSSTKEYVVSYRNCDGGDKFVRRKSDEIKPNQTFRGKPCPQKGSER